MSADQENVFQVKLAWVGLEVPPVHTVNHIASQFDDNLFYVSFGLATPPLLLGSPEERRKQAEGIEVVPIETLARIALTPSTMEKLIAVLQQNLEASQSRYHKPSGEGE